MNSACFALRVPEFTIKMIKCVEFSPSLLLPCMQEVVCHQQVCSRPAASCVYLPAPPPIKANSSWPSQAALFCQPPGPVSDRRALKLPYISVFIRLCQSWKWFVVLVAGAVVVCHDPPSPSSLPVTSPGIHCCFIF